MKTTPDQLWSGVVDLPQSAALEHHAEGDRNECGASATVVAEMVVSCFDECVESGQWNRESAAYIITELGASAR
jgi:hypothetical protein